MMRCGECTCTTEVPYTSRCTRRPIFQKSMKIELLSIFCLLRQVKEYAMLLGCPKIMATSSEFLKFTTPRIRGLDRYFFRLLWSTRVTVFFLIFSDHPLALQQLELLLSSLLSLVKRTFYRFASVTGSHVTTKTVVGGIKILLGIPYSPYLCLKALPR